MVQRIAVGVVGVLIVVLLGFIGFTLATRGAPSQSVVVVPVAMATTQIAVAATVVPSATASPVASGTPVGSGTPVASAAPVASVGVPTRTALPSPVASAAYPTGTPRVAGTMVTLYPDGDPRNPTINATEQIEIPLTITALSVMMYPTPPSGSGCAPTVIYTEPDISTGYSYATVQLPVRSYMLIERPLNSSRFEMSAMGMTMVVNPVDNTLMPLQPVYYLNALLKKKTEEERSKLPPGFIFQAGTYTLRYDGSDLTIYLMICPVVP